MASKKWSMFVGASVLAGIAGSIFFKNRKKELSGTELDTLKDQYSGSWWFIDTNKHIQHELILNEDFTLKIDGRLIIGSLIELTATRLVFQDHLGFHIILTSSQGRPKSIYDEADDLTYELIPKEN